MHGQHDVTTPEAYLAALEEPRRSEIARIDAFIRETVPEFAPCIVYKILGYGPFRSRDAKGKEQDAAMLALSSNKQYISLYVMAAQNGEYLAERRAAELPKAKVGKSCIRFKRFEDLDPDALRRILREATQADYSCV
jgi:hypothetical protein